MIGRMWGLPELAYLMVLTIRKFTYLGENTISLFSTLCAELRLIYLYNLRYWGSNIVKGWAGDYFEMNTQSLLKLNYKNEKLSVGVTELSATGNATFSVPNSSSTLTFTGDSLNAQLEVFTEGAGRNTYKKANKISLSSDKMEEYQGYFYSSELDTKYSLSIKDSSLLIKRPRYDDIKLEPLLKDIFTVAGTSIIRFQRKKKDKIEGFYISAGRVRNLYFEKMVAK